MIKALLTMAPARYPGGRLLWDFLGVLTGVALHPLPTRVQLAFSAMGAM